MMTPWIVAAWAVFASAAVALCTMHIAAGARMMNRRYRLAWTEPAQLLDPPKPHPTVVQLTTVLTIALSVLALVLLAPASPFWRPGPLAALMLALGGFASAGVVFRSLQRHWSPCHAMLASALISAGICGLARCTIPFATSERAHVQALVVGLAIAGALWCWLAGVWMQQLDGGSPWTVAGRLIPFSRPFALANAGLGVVGAWAIALDDKPATGGSLFVSLTAHAVLLAAIALCLRRWRGADFTGLLLATIASALVLTSRQLFG